MLTIRDGSSGPSTFHHDEGFDWGKYIKDERTKKRSLVAEVKQSREVEHARAYLSGWYKKYREARWANRWDADRECYVDPKGNPTIDPDEVDEGIRKVLYASLEKKKKTVEEIVDESQKLVDEVKKADEKAVAEEQEVNEESQKQMTKEVEVPKAEVIIQTDASDSSIRIDNKI
ncbi:hypothetical protein Hanom_Chr10g00923401 [Helianthus anomalus]